MNRVILESIHSSRDPRLSYEARNFTSFISQNFPVPKELDVQVMRQRCENIHAKANEKFLGTFQGAEKEQKIKVQENREIPITIYTPVDAKRDKIVVYFHGGGWVAGSRKTHQNIVNIVADATKTVWISVEYGLSPEHKFPVWLDDACEATRQILANKTAYGGDENTKIGVAGDSAGALISASVCHTIRNIDFQILIHGGFSFVYRTKSCKEFTRPEHVATPGIINWYTLNALRDENDKHNPRASVLLNESFDGLPSCLFIVAELDPFRDDNYEYQTKLDQAGVKTKLVVVKNVTHAFFPLPGIFEMACGQAVGAIKEFMDEL